jgi:hypothetical protein
VDNDAQLDAAANEPMVEPAAQDAQPLVDDDADDADDTDGDPHE